MTKHMMVNLIMIQVTAVTDHGQFKHDPHHLGNIPRSFKLYIHVKNGAYFMINLLTATPFSV